MSAAWGRAAFALDLARWCDTYLDSVQTAQQHPGLDADNRDFLQAQHDAARAMGEAMRQRAAREAPERATEPSHDLPARAHAQNSQNRHRSRL